MLACYPLLTIKLRRKQISVPSFDFPYSRNLWKTSVAKQTAVAGLCCLPQPHSQHPATAEMGACQQPPATRSSCWRGNGRPLLCVILDCPNCSRIVPNFLPPRISVVRVVLDCQKDTIGCATAPSCLLWLCMRLRRSLQRNALIS